MSKKRLLTVTLLVLTVCCLAAPGLLAAEPTVLKVVTVANPQQYDGPSPAMVWFYAAVIVGKYPVSLTYQWERSDGAVSRPQTIMVKSPVQGITATWTFGAPGESYQVWEKLHIIAPVDLISEPAEATVNCLAPPPSEPSELETPRQLEPVNGAVFNYYPRQTTLRWSPVGGARSYCVEVDYYDTDWVSERGETYIMIENLSMLNYTFNFIGAQPGRWRVWAVGYNGEESPKSDWSEFRFTK